MKTIPSPVSRRAVRRCLMLVAGLVLMACSTPMVTVEIPPQVDLNNWPLIGVVDFDAVTHPELATAATQQFQSQLQGAQQGVRLLELGSSEEVLQGVHQNRLDPAAIKAIGEKYGVAAVLTGALEVSEPTPDFKISSDLRSLRAKASVKGELSAKLRETSTGATVWNNGAHGTWSIAKVNLGVNGLSNLAMTPPAERYDQMLRDLTRVATEDFRPHYERRRVAQ